MKKLGLFGLVVAAMVLTGCGTIAPLYSRSTVTANLPRGSIETTSVTAGSGLFRFDDVQVNPHNEHRAAQNDCEARMRAQEAIWEQARQVMRQEALAAGINPEPRSFYCHLAGQANFAAQCLNFVVAGNLIQPTQCGGGFGYGASWASMPRMYK
ncbi:MAG: hypothetical protein WCV84_02990 [Patescibacteria group bacterium]